MPSSGTGLRMTSMRSAASVSMSSRPSNSAERVQTMRALVMRSQIPSPVGDRDLADGGVRGQNALDAVDPDLPVRRRQLTFDEAHEIGLSASASAASCAKAGRARKSSAMAKTNRVKTPVLFQRKKRPSGSSGAGRAERRVEPDRTEPGKIAQACADAHLEFLREIRE